MPTTTIVMLPVYETLNLLQTVGPGDGLTYAYVGQTVNLADNINSTPPSVNRFTGYLSSFVNTGNPSFTANFTFDITDPTDLRSLFGTSINPSVYSRSSGRYVLEANYATSDGAHTLKFRGFFECLKSYTTPPVPVPEGTRTALVTLTVDSTQGTFNNNSYTVSDYTGFFDDMLAGLNITVTAPAAGQPPATLT